MAIGQTFCDLSHIIVKLSDTEPHWQRHFEAADVTDVPPPGSDEASIKWSAVVPASWKSAYVTHTLQERASGESGGVRQCF